ncbi:unnamed protein product, partial [Effrenium voratum]
ASCRASSVWPPASAATKRRSLARSWSRLSSDLRGQTLATRSLTSFEFTHAEGQTPPDLDGSPDFNAVGALGAAPLSPHWMLVAE